MKPPRPCTVTDCERVYYARGFCILHYARWRRHGSTDKPKPHTPAKDAPANPWRGQQVCPECENAAWSMPFDAVDLPHIWNCCACGTTFTVPALALAPSGSSITSPRPGPDGASGGTGRRGPSTSSHDACPSAASGVTSKDTDPRRHPGAGGNAATDIAAQGA